MAQTPREIFEDYEPLFQSYELLAAEVAARVEKSLRYAGVRPVVTHRAKDVRSLIKKCILYGGPTDLVGDKAGVKVVVRYSSEVEIVEQVISDNFLRIEPPDDKAATYRPHELGYLGVHHQIKLRSDNCPEALAGLQCEIIVHTGAQSLWDSITHELMYKPLLELPEEAKRALCRLMAFVEDFDERVNTVRGNYVQSPTYREARMLDILEKYFYRFDPRDYRRDMSIRTLEALSPLVPAEKIEALDYEISEFVESNSEVLTSIFSKFQNPNDHRGIFLHQPEVLLIFAMFSWGQRFDVKDAWLSLYPRADLEELGSMWSTVIPP